MNFLEETASLWLSQQQPLTTWHSCSTRSPEPMIGACEKQKIFQPARRRGTARDGSRRHATARAAAALPACRRRAPGSPSHAVALTVLGRVRLDRVDPPLELLLIHEDLVRGVLRIAEDRRADANDEGLLGDLVAELRRLLAEARQVSLEVLPRASAAGGRVSGAARGGRPSCLVGSRHPSPDLAP